MLPVKWTTQATWDLIEIISYIEQRNPRAAQEMHELFVQAADRLSQMPYLFRRGRVAGTREYVVHPNYILIYQVNASSIDVIRLLHAKQEYPRN